MTGIGVWWIRSVAALAILLVCFSTAVYAQAEMVVATGTRVGGDQARTRFVTDLTRAVSYTVYVLPQPYRVIIDLPNVTFDLPAGVGRKTRGLISEYRYGEVGPGRSRIVIDTKGPVFIEKSFIVESDGNQPARIVVDLVQTTPEKFLATYGKEESLNDAAVAAAAEAAAEEPYESASVQPAMAPPGDVASEPLAAPLALPPPDRPPRRNGRKLVVIDPGHGGVDPGAIGLNKTKEKDVVLAFGLALQEKLKQSGEYDVELTRDDDVFVSLKDRVKVAREKEADLFIAIHADILRGQSTRGATIYTLSETASDAEAEALAQKENHSDIIGGINLGVENEEVTGILIDLVQRESKNHSVFFARKAVAEMKSVTAFTGKPLRSAGFVVLKAPDVPSVLIELGFLSSRRDEAQLKDEAWRNKVAAAMARAVDKYFSREVAAREK